MRSSKKRSRSNQNRPRTLGNIINRVFDSSGPEGKVRGTPQQIIEKYQMLARDAQLSNDRVAAENFLQHAEHYTRMLAEAMREMAAEQEARQQQYQQQGGGQNGGQNGAQNGGHNGNQNGGNPRPDREYRENRENRDNRDNRDRGERHDRGDRRPEFLRDPGTGEQPGLVDVIDLETGNDSGLIETPETTAEVRSEASAKAPKPAGEEAAPRRSRGPRKPKAEAGPDGAPPKEAAE
jgi:hypothetical protein